MSVNVKRVARYKLLRARYPRIVQPAVRYSGSSIAKGVILAGGLFIGLERLRLHSGDELYLCWAWGLRDIRQPAA